MNNKDITERQKNVPNSPLYKEGPIPANKRIWNYWSLVFILFLSISSLNAQSQLIKADAYLDVRTGKLIQPANIIIEQGVILAINPVKTPTGIEIIDLSGQIILPGLMDMHVHLNMDFVENYPFLLVTESASKSTLRATKNAELTLMAGFTTVRNLGQVNPAVELIDVALAEASDAGWIKAPRIIPSGHMIGITGGHADISMMGGFAEEIMDLGPKHGIADGVDELLKATRYQIKHGAQAIKIMATAGVLSLEESVGAQQLSDEEMRTVVEEANRHGITIAAHAHGTEGIIAAINAGVTSIEHGSLLTDEAIELMIEKGTFLVPTTGLFELLANGYDKMDPRIAEKAKYIIPVAIESHEKAIQAGVKIALGTDAPLIPHGSNALELTTMVNRGMQPIDAIRAATINPAEMLHLSDRGEIKEGFLADIIAVTTNPIENIQTLENVKFVMKGGVVFKKED